MTPAQLRIGARISRAQQANIRRRRNAEADYAAGRITRAELQRVRLETRVQSAFNFLEVVL